VPIGHGNSFFWSWKSHGKSLLKKSGHPDDHSHRQHSHHQAHRGVFESGNQVREFGEGSLHWGPGAKPRGGGSGGRSSRKLKHFCNRYTLNFETLIVTIFAIVTSYSAALSLGDRWTVVLYVLSVCDVGVLWSNGWMDQGATWYRSRPQPRPHCVRWGPSSLQKGAQQPHPPFCPCLLWPNGYPSQQLLTSC